MDDGVSRPGGNRGHLQQGAESLPTNCHGISKCLIGLGEAAPSSSSTWMIAEVPEPHPSLTRISVSPATRW